MDNLLTTPLTSWHREHGAKMAPFAGFDMPISYRSILDEHRHTRTKASLFDICHMGEFMLTGDRALESLSRLVTQNLATLAPGKCRYGFLLNDNGCVIDDLLVYRLDPGSFMLVVNGARMETDREWIKERLGAGAELEDISQRTAKIDLQGPEAFKAFEQVLGQPVKLKYFTFDAMHFEQEPLLVSRTGYTGELGLELYVHVEKALALWERLLEAEVVEPAGLGARDTLRLEIGLPLYGQDLDEEHTPAEAGYAGMLKSEAEYTGKTRAFDVRESLVPLKLDGRRSARHNDAVLTSEGAAVGRVTSGSFAPSLGYAVALAYVDAQRAGDKEFLIDAGRSQLRAERVGLPFFTEGGARKKIE
ncbi:MAG: aminomethyltransferase [Desulfovibrionales bacterium]|nr:aminomethyltransferase [Desulfovibrionales bacterium]